MNKLTIEKGNIKYEMLIDHYKIIYGHNYNSKFDILRTLLRFNNNIKPSEYAEEKNNIPNISLNDKSIKTKDTFIYYVNKNYSIIDDFKLSTKSLIYKYLEILLDDHQLMDTINTINILFESLNNEISLISDISCIFNSMVPKQLLKLLSPIYQINQLSQDEYDLSLEQIILFQLNLIDYIINNNHKINDFIICIEIPELTQEIFNKILRMNNVNILIFIEYKNSICKDINKYFICERKCLDICDDDQVYLTICDNQFQFLNLKEGREYMEKYLFNEESLESRFIMKLLNI